MTNVLPHGARNTMQVLLDALDTYLAQAGDRQGALNAVRELLHRRSPTASHPVDRVIWVPLEDVEPNDYNPNAVAREEMKLLLHSIEQDGYTQPVVTILDAERQKYVIVDGFHRYYVAYSTPAVQQMTGGRLPIVVLDKGINDRMASTVRHNRARGVHSVQGMASMVFKMLDGGMEDAAICNELGMEPEELLRLKHITGFSKLFANREYNRAWVSRNQVDVRRRYQASQVVDNGNGAAGKDIAPAEAPKPPESSTT